MTQTIEIELTDEQADELKREAEDRMARRADTKDEVAELGEPTADEYATYLILHQLGEVY